MSEYTVTMSFSGVRSRILITAGTDEILRAVLPPPRQVRHTQAALSFLEALALWLDRSPRVVVSVRAHRRLRDTPARRLLQRRGRGAQAPPARQEARGRR